MAVLLGAVFSLSPLAGNSDGRAVGAAARPVHLKFYYGSLHHVDDRADVAHGIRQLLHFDLIVTAEPGELDREDRAVLEGLLEAGREVYGYLDLASAKDGMGALALYEGMERLAAAGYAGVFFDQAGYDYGVTRHTLNQAVAFAHARGLRVMANAWLPTDVLGSGADPQMNPAGEATLLGPGDWILLESFYSRSDDQYAGTPEGGVEPVLSKYQAAVEAAHRLGVRVAALAYHTVQKPLTVEIDRRNALVLALMLGLDGWAYGRSDNNSQIPWPQLPLFPWRWDRFCGPMQSVAGIPGLWQRETDAGTLFFFATERPLRRRAGFLPGGSGCSPTPAVPSSDPAPAGPGQPTWRL